MGGRRKQADKTFEIFHGIGPSADLELGGPGRPLPDAFSTAPRPAGSDQHAGSSAIPYLSSERVVDAHLKNNVSI